MADKEYIALWETKYKEFKVTAYEEKMDEVSRKNRLIDVRRDIEEFIQSTDANNNDKV